MTCTNQQVKKLMKEKNLYTQEALAARAGMHVQTARKYLRLNKLPSELKKPHDWQTREDAFAEVWEEVESFLETGHGIQAKTVFEYLRNKYPGRFVEGQLRTLQRRFETWRVLKGKGREVIFPQKHEVGVQSQSDYTNMNDLRITIAGEQFKHLLFHFILTYSRWEHVNVCYEESFASLSEGYEKAVWMLGAVAPEHRTDNLTAATKKADCGREFTENWQKVMKHYGVKATKNNPGKGNENGSVEKSHDLFKTAVDQQLMLRGSRNFSSLEEYEKFLEGVLSTRNCTRKEALAEELKKLKELPDDKWCAPKVLPVSVSTASTIRFEKETYSVPSRLINYSLMAHIYHDRIKLFYGQKCLIKMQRNGEEPKIDYRHIIDSLIRKHGAFANYQYKEALFPRLCFRKAYDELVEQSPTHGHKYYLEILLLAKMHGEQQVAAGLELLRENQEACSVKRIKELLDLPIKHPKVKVNEPTLKAYDQLLCGKVNYEVAP